MRTTLHRVSGTLAAALLLAALLPGLAGCSTIERAKPRPKSARVDRSFQIDAPRIMAGTIASQTIILGYQPVVVRGYGLVVGLDDTGSRDIPPALRAHMLTEMARHGIGKQSAGLGHLNPERMLDSPRTAVVIVEAVVPPGAVGRRVRQDAALEGTRFDVRVYADPRTGTTSLEGGRLYTAPLRPVRPGQIFPPLGSRQAAPLAEAGGPIFINPFAEPGAVERDAINRTVGRVLQGGEVLKDMPIKLRLATPSHVRAEIIQNAINARFPREPGQRDPTARGESDESIRVNVPPSFRDRTDEFVELLRHTTIRQSGVEGNANNVKRLLLNDPSYAYDAAWRWHALGPRALPMIRDLYEHPQEAPRTAALRAGAKLEDPLVVRHLVDMTKSDSAEGRRQAVSLLRDMQLDPRIDTALRGLLNDDDVDVRLAAYEALVERADPFIDRHDVDDKFVLDVIDSESPLIYITQVGRPRVAVFGRDLSLDRPLLVDAWSGRFIVKAEEDEEQVEVYYRPETGGERLIQETDPRLEGFIQFLGHETTIEQPDPGLGLSYGETVGALYRIWRDDGIEADFKAEQDRVLAAIIRQQQQQTTLEERPEFGDPDYDYLQPEGPPIETGEETASDLDRLAPPPEVGGE
ncbi:MAG: flagellar basal body P-ring protein FlgI [Planctomycetota bacterium]|nr:flagellar basal body P-ring protein FlgI [Planctomycetota bacterium]